MSEALHQVSDGVRDFLRPTSAVADIFGVQEETVREWTRRGVLPAVHLGRRRTMIRQSTIDDVLAHGLTTTMVEASRVEQGLPPKVTDPDALARVAGLIASTDADGGAAP